MFFLALAGIIAATPELPLALGYTADARSIFANPAGLGAVRGFEFYYHYEFQPGEFLQNNSFALSAGPLGCFLEPRPLRYGFGLGLKQENLLAGVRFVRDSFTRWDLGALIRVSRWASFGGVWEGMNIEGGRVGVGVGVRPLGLFPKIIPDAQNASRLTISGDAYFHPFQPFIGVEFEPVTGVQVAGRAKVFSEAGLEFVAGITLSFGRFGLGGFYFPGARRLSGQVRLTQEVYPALLSGGKRYLELRLAEGVVEEKPGFSLLGTRRVRTTYGLLELLRRAGDARRVAGLVLKLQAENLSFAQAQELRQALFDFRAKGKWVWVYAHRLGMLGFYIASAADRIILHPMGEVVIPGVSTQAQFLKGALEKLGIEVQAYRAGRYKGAVEMFTEESLSVANREQLQALVDGLYGEFVSGVAAGRNLSPAAVESLISRAFFRADEAQAAGLCDTAVYEDELDSLLKREFRGVRPISERAFLRERVHTDRWDSPTRIAVVYATGSIVEGESGTDLLTGEQTLGSVTLAQALRQVARDRKVRGVVLRVDSPGGDGFASDVLNHEIQLLRRKKPVVVSMGTMAASGGYYISCNADRIFALPGTITGSIGVFNLRLVTEGLYNRLGVRRQTVRRGEHADLLRDIRRATPEEDSIIQAAVDWFYREFLERVAKGRALSVERVDSVAQGRVWLGRDAIRFGLVDSLGGLSRALEFCRQKANVGRDYQLVFYPRPRPGLLSLFRPQFEELLFGIFGR